ncbi:MAG TPA: exodeoxyribonuclease VII small subunit [Thermoleophilaceae bacterium]|jgi:exodeoxyribonuclease VII small subunit
MSTEAAKAITFSDAYTELKSITDTLNADQVEVDALVPLLRRGKGLEAALRAHLEQVEQEVEAIEAGEGITPYRIVAPEAAAPAAEPAARSLDAAPPNGSVADDIPF